MIESFKVDFLNHKLLQDTQAEFKAGNLYYIEGSNEKGKTTFINALRNLITGKANKTNNVTYGQTDGYVKGEFNLIGGNKEKYIIKWDFTQEKNSFVIIDPKTNVHKSTSRNNIVAEIFKYNDFTIDEWFQWGLTSEGRRKQASILLNLLPPDILNKYNKLEGETNTTYGTLYSKRTKENNIYDSIKMTLDSLKITNDDLATIKKENEYNKIVEKYNSNKVYKSEKELLEVKYNSIEDKIKSLNKELLEKENIQNINNKRDNDLISEYLKKIEDLRLKIQKDIQSFNEFKVNYEKNIDECNKEKENINIFLNEYNNMDIISDDIFNNAKSELNKILLLKDKANKFTSTQQKLQQQFEIINNLNNEISNKRKEKTELLSLAKLPENIIIEDGEVMYKDNDNIIPFTENNVSYSSGGMVIAKLMIMLNKTLPIWLFGKAESYDTSRIKEFIKLAEENNGIIIMDKVIENENTPLSIKCVEL